MSSLYHNNITGRTVEMMHYIANRTNQEVVMRWIDSRMKSEWAAPFTAKAGGAYELIAVYAKPGNTFYVRPDSVIYVTDTEDWFQTTKADFLANFTAGPPQPFDPEPHTYFNLKTLDPVLAITYLSDRSNEAEVIKFLNQFADPALTYPPAKADPRQSRINFQYAPGSTLYIYPGQIAYIRPDTYESSAMGVTSFSSLFTKTLPASTPTPKDTVFPESIVSRYAQITDPSVEVRAIRYTRGNSSKTTAEFLKQYGMVAGIPNLYNGELTFYPSVDVIEVAYSANKRQSTPVQIPDGFWVTVTRRRNKLPLLTLHTNDVFRAYFTKFDPDSIPAPLKETTVINNYFHASLSAAAEPSEYQTNREAVLDALAPLRTIDYSDSDFELVSRELMDLLASAFNEGWDEGLEAGQRNPYEDRA